MIYVLCVYKNDLVDGFSLGERIAGILSFLCYLFPLCLDSYNEYMFLCNQEGQRYKT